MFRRSLRSVTWSVRDGVIVLHRGRGTAVTAGVLPIPGPAEQEGSRDMKELEGQALNESSDRERGGS